MTEGRRLAVALEARRLVGLGDRWLNPPEWVEWVDEPVPDYPKRPVARDEDAARGLKKRTLTNLYNARPQWLVDAHAALDATVAAEYGWSADIHRRRCSAGTTGAQPCEWLTTSYCPLPRFEGCEDSAGGIRCGQIRRASNADAGVRERRRGRSASRICCGRRGREPRKCGPAARPDLAVLDGRQKRAEYPRAGSCSAQCVSQTASRGRRLLPVKESVRWRRRPSIVSG